MLAVARKRLSAERKSFRKKKPFGFYARPEKNPDGSQNLFKWKCGIPGKRGTAWEGGIYTLYLTFPSDFPKNPPQARFTPKIYHPNVFPDTGDVCLSILKPEKGWAASISVCQILVGIQTLLTDPNNLDPANSRARDMMEGQRAQYDKTVQEQALRFTP
ncbi:hypothetical protein AAMO2058_001298500 [Amorphochlora amoebiformis]